MKDDESFIITTAPADLHSVSQALAKVGSEGGDRRVRPWIPKSSVRVEGANAEPSC